MNPHTLINAREELQEIDNLLRRDFEGIKKPLSEAERTPYNLVALVYKGRKLKNEQLMGGTYYCHDCSRERGRMIEHYNRPVFQDYIQTPIIRKHAKNLQRIQEII